MCRRLGSKSRQRRLRIPQGTVPVPTLPNRFLYSLSQPCKRVAKFENWKAVPWAVSRSPSSSWIPSSMNEALVAHVIRAAEPSSVFGFFHSFGAGPRQDAFIREPRVKLGVKNRFVPVGFKEPSGADSGSCLRFLVMNRSTGSFLSSFENKPNKTRNGRFVD